MKKVYEIKKDVVEIKEVAKVVAGCTLDQGDHTPEIVETFDNKEEALEALENYETSVRRLSSNNGTYYEVVEYYVEEAIYNEDGEWEDGGDVVQFTEMVEF